MRFWGKIGVARGPQETDTGIFTEIIDEIEVSGEMRSIGARWQNMDASNPTARHVFSMIAPEKTEIDINEVVYIWWKDRQWSVTAIEYKPPRVELSLGGMYNG